jgi:hypothetical protein
MAGLPITCPKLWFSRTTRKTWSAVAEAGGGLVVTLEETPPHPAQIRIAAKNKDVKTRFILALQNLYAQVLAFGLDAWALPGAAQS